MTKVKKSSILLTCLLLALLCGVLFYIDGNASKYIIRITRLCAINIVLALSMNLVNGFTGIFSLGHAGFMAIGAYAAAMGGVDAIIFTAGVGENSASQRMAIASGLEFMGVKMDEDANKVRGEERVISAPDSKVTVLLIPTNEELMIAMDTEALVG